MPNRIRSLAVGAVMGALLAAAPAAARVDDDPLPRFEDRVCPGIMGLRTDAAETMVGMIRTNVEAFGLGTVNKEVCEPNLVVAFVDDGQAFLVALQARHETVFAEMARHDREQLVSEAGPALALLRVRSRSRDGMPISRRENLMDAPQTYMAMAHSRIYTATRKDIVASLVLIDRDAVRGLSLRQLADYATFRALTRTLPPADARGASIVGLFDSMGNRPAGLTDFDRTFLATLYGGVPNLPGSARLAELTHATGYDFASEE